MVSNGYILAAVLISAALTWAMRAAPFAVLAKIRTNPLVGFLAQQMPLGVMIILVIYLVRDTPWTPLWQFLPFAAAIGITVGLHLWKRNAFLSIFAGTGTYVALQAVFG